jgi:hypothetical protein
MCAARKVNRKAPGVTFACQKSIGHLKRKDRVQMQACVELTGCVVGSIDELEYNVPLTLPFNRHRLASS